MAEHSFERVILRVAITSIEVGRPAPALALRLRCQVYSCEFLDKTVKGCVKSGNQTPLRALSTALQSLMLALHERRQISKDDKIDLEN
jgi:hypothetical protein